jgi:hypothetical protein
MRFSCASRGRAPSWFGMRRWMIAMLLTGCGGPMLRNAPRLDPGYRQPASSIVPEEVLDRIDGK